MRDFHLQLLQFHARKFARREEEADWQTRDPIQKLRAAMNLDTAAFEKLETEIEFEVDAAVEFAQSSPEPLVEDWESAVYA